MAAKSGRKVTPRLQRCKDTGGKSLTLELRRQISVPRQDFDERSGGCLELFHWQTPGFFAAINHEMANEESGKMLDFGNAL